MTNTMTDPTTALDAQLERYLAMYNDPDPDRRREVIEALWVPDAVLANAATIYRGHREIVVGVARSHDAWVATGHRFRSAGTTSVHHGAARFGWHMVLGDEPEPVSVGTSFLQFTVDGRIASDVQFIDR